MINIFTKDIDLEKYFVVTYFLESKTSLREAAWNLAIGQSIGNPNNRSVWETEEMFLNHSCFIMEDEDYLKSLKDPGHQLLYFVMKKLETLQNAFM